MPAVPPPLTLPLAPCAPPLTPGRPPLWKQRRATTILTAAFLLAAQSPEGLTSNITHAGVIQAVEILARTSAAARPHPNVDPISAASHLLSRGQKKAAQSAALGVTPVSAKDSLQSKGFHRTDLTPLFTPSPALSFTAFCAAEVKAACLKLKSIGPGPTGLRPNILTAALVGTAASTAAASVLTRLLRERPAWLMRTRPLVLRKPSGGVRVIETSEAVLSLLELMVLARRPPSPSLDVAAMAVTTKARILRGDELVIADITDGFNVLPHSHILTWAAPYPETLMLVTSQLANRCLVDEEGGYWTRAAGGPTGARTTCMAFCELMRGVLHADVDVFVDDVICPLNLWDETQAAVASLGLAFGVEKTFGYNMPSHVTDIPPPPSDAHILGAPLHCASRRVEKLRKVCARMDNHDSLTLAAGDLFSSLNFDLQISEPAALADITSLVDEVTSRAGLAPGLMPLTPGQASEACIIALITRMLATNAPHAWRLLSEAQGWFGHASRLLAARNFAVDFVARTVSSPQAVPLDSPPKRILSLLAKAARRAQDHQAVAAGVPSPQSNVITRLLVAGGERPHLTDAMVSTAASLRADDTPALQTAAKGSLCPLCRRLVKSHHPLLCDAISHRGRAHDNLVRHLAVQTAKNPGLTVRANKAHLGPNGREGRFRPDLAIEETAQLFEIKTLNAEAHGPRLHRDFINVAIDARAKYLREIQREPWVIAASTDGYVPKEGFRALEQLTNSANLDMPTVGPRLMLIAGLALAESAAGAYKAWYLGVGGAIPVGGSHNA